MQRLALDNGLRVVMDPDPSAPSVAVCMVLRVGRRDEPADQLGIAELAAAAAARGSGATTLEQIALAHGGVTSHEVTPDFTRFCTELPSTELETAIGLEATRLHAVALTPSELGTVATQWAQVWNASAGPPYARAPMKLFELAFEGHPYALSRAGLLKPEQWRPEEVAAFQNAHYQPDAAALGVVGKFDPARARELIARDFGVARGHAQPRTDPPAANRQTTERLCALELPGAASVSAVYGWVIPPSSTATHRTFELVARLLGDGDSLTRELASSRTFAQSATARVASLEGPDLLELRFVTTAGTSMDDAKNAVDAVIARLRALGPSAIELERARQRVRSDLLAELQSRSGRAGWLAERAFVGTTQGPFDDYLAPFDGVSAADVRKAVAEYLTPNRRTVIEVYPPKLLDPPAVHIVGAGASPRAIAKQNRADVPTPAKKNPPASSERVAGLPKLRLPSGAVRKQRLHVVHEGDTLAAIAKRYGISVGNLVSQNHLRASSPIVTGQKLLVPPIAKADH